MDNAATYGLEAFVFFTGICLLLWIVLEGSFRLGRSQTSRFNAEAKLGLRDMQSAFLTLISLLLAFGVSMAEVRFEARKQNLSEEGVSFGTTFMREKLLPDSVQNRFKELLKRNLEERIEFYSSGASSQVQTEIQQKIGATQKALWAVVTESARKAPYTTSLPLVIQSLNETFDVQERQNRAYKNHLPESLVVMLLLSTAIVVASVGFLNGLDGKRRIIYTSLLAILFGMTLFVIMDLDRPRAGLIQIHPGNLSELLERVYRSGS